MDLDEGEAIIDDMVERLRIGLAVADRDKANIVPVFTEDLRMALNYVTVLESFVRHVEAQWNNGG